MIRSYKYLPSIHSRLNELVIEFFDRIQFETGPFQEQFFGYSLGYLANRHPQILKQRCIAIYSELKTWSFRERAKLFYLIRESNQIEKICCGSYEPRKLDRHATGIYKELRDLFIDLYNQVLDGDAFRELFSTNLREHFSEFRKLNSDVTICPLCGIGELKMDADKIRDQYDHYFPKSTYPLSSVNFKNLVPICRECNSTDIKGDTDIIAVSSNDKLFFLFDTNHKGIQIEFQISADHVDIENIHWEIVFTNPDNKIDEIESWRTIYHIEIRYIGYIKGRIEKWFRHYWEFVNDQDMVHLSEADRNLACFKFLDKDESLGLSFIRKPALICFLRDSVLAQATIEARLYSLPTAV